MQCMRLVIRANKFSMQFFLKLGIANKRSINDHEALDGTTTHWPLVLKQVHDSSPHYVELLLHFYSIALAWRGEPLGCVNTIRGCAAQYTVICM